MNNIKEILDKKTKRLNYINSINVIGSCAYDTITEDKKKEIDFYIVVKKMTPSIMSEIIKLFNCLKKIYPNILIELRRGPFKNKSAKQIHLIIDDYESIHHTSDITLNDWSLNSLNIYGSPITKLVPMITKKSLINSFNEELFKTISMVTNHKIFYKEWSLKNDRLTLRNKEKHVSSLYEYLVLLKYAYTAMRNNWTSLHNLKTSNSDIIFDREQELLPLRKSPLIDCHKAQLLTSNVLSFNLGLVKQLDFMR